jgi:hypothetical protein
MHYILRRGKRKFPTSKVQRQYFLVLLVEVCWREGKAFGSEGGKGLESGRNKLLGSEGGKGSESE